MPTLQQLRELSEKNCRFHCQSFENIEYELAKCSAVFAFLGTAAQEIGRSMRTDDSFSLGPDEMYGFGYLLEGFQKSVDLVLDQRGRTKAA